MLGWGLCILVLLVVSIIFYFIEVEEAKRILEATEGLHGNPHNLEAQKSYSKSILVIQITLLFVILFNKFLMVVLFHKFADW